MVAEVLSDKTDRSAKIDRMNMNSPVQDQDSQWMAQALALAQQALWRTSPNPRVGCVLVSRAGQVIGRGSTQAAGQAHAEVMALRDANAQGHAPEGATAYVTLEPCAHQGRTGPCCDALIAAGISRVVVALGDPNPLVGGQGLARLKAAGVQVCVGEGAQASRDLNLGFLSRWIRQRPWVRMKLAMSLDGKTALKNGESQWITGGEARADGQCWRARACAVMTGSGTVLQDDPVLNVRDFSTPRQPHLVVLDSQLRTPMDARLWQPSRKVFIYGSSAGAERLAAMRSQAHHVALLAGEDGRVNLHAVMQDLARQEINELHVEAGHILSGALLEAGLVDELLLYMAPKMIGPGQGLVQLQERMSLDACIEWTVTDLQMVGSDVRVLARVKGHDQF